MMDLIGVRFETLEDEGATYTAYSPQECLDKVDEDIFNRIMQDRETGVITQGHTFAIPLWG